jgi:hypothetical protein
MWRWTIRVLAGLCSLIVVTALTGAAYQWLATRKDLAVTPPPGQLVDIGGYGLQLRQLTARTSPTGHVRFPSAPEIVVGCGASRRRDRVARETDS